MAMTWDAPLVAALAKELWDRLRGDRLRAHEFRWEERELLLHFRGGTLRWALHPARGWVTVEEAREPPPEARPLAAHLTEILAPPDERILEMRFKRPRGKVREVRVVFELMTNQWNALLLEGADLRIRHLLWTRPQEERPLVVGRSYHPPKNSTRRGIHRPLEPSEWEALVGSGRKAEIRKRLLEEVAFTSPINLPGLLPGESGTANDPEPGQGKEARRALPEGLRGLPLWEALRKGDPTTPCILESSRDKFPYPFIIYTYKFTHFSDLLSAIRHFSEGEKGGVEGTRGLLERVDAVLGRARRKAARIRREMEESGDPEEFRGRANLLLARKGDVPRGTASVALEGFAGEKVELELDPSLDARENAEALYAEAARRERGAARLPALLEEAEGAVRDLEELIRGVQAGEVSGEEALRRLPQNLRKRPGQTQGERLPYRRFRSSGGLEIRVGRGSRDNDALTFRHSHPMDVWLHARDSSGAHVILRWAGEDPPPRKDLEEAAILAALNSGERGAATVPVDWTRRKYVRKARKAPPGTVILSQVKTLFVKPDPELAERLRETGPSRS